MKKKVKRNWGSLLISILIVCIILLLISVIVIYNPFNISSFNFSAKKIDSDVSSLKCAKPADIILVIDKSSSMSEGSKLDEAKAAAVNFLDVLAGDERIGVVSFSRTAILDSRLVDLKTNKQSLKNTINNLNTDSFTNIGAGILVAQKEISDNSRENAVHVIILLSDGSPNVQNYPDWTMCTIFGSNPTSDNECTLYAKNQASLAKQAGTIIYSIGLQVNSGFPEDLLKKISSSDNRYFPSSTPQNLKQIYAEIAKKICVYEEVKIPGDEIQKFSFFSWFNFIIAIILIMIVYSVLNIKKIISISINR